MTRTSSDGRNAAPAFLALAAIGFVASAPAALANDADPVAASDPQREEQRADVVVTGEQVRSEQESPKATRPVRDTPQTVTIITAKTIEDQNLLTLRDQLSTVPGITFGAAEGGSPPADSITFRGFSASTDITQDGVRDSAAYSRSDSFNLEQIEVLNGASSVQSGAGSVGGSINIVTKRPKRETEILVSGGIGTHEYYRGTIDANLRVNELIAVRLNAMVHQNDVPGRDVDKYERWGVAPSVKIGVEGPTSLILQYIHQEDNNIPQYGVPYYNGLVAGVDRSSYYGYRNVDRQDIVVDQATAIFEHELSENWSVRNLARWQNITQLTVVGPPQGTYCVAATNLTPTGGSCGTTPAGYYLIGGPRGNYRDSKNELMYDQVDFKGQFSTGAIEHTLVVGASALWEKYSFKGGNALRNPDGSVVYNPYPLINIANPNEVIVGPAAPGRVYGSNVYVGPVNLTVTSRNQGEVENYAAYAFNTMKLGKFELTAGLRYENFAAESRNIVTNVRGDTDADLFSYRFGLAYKPVTAVTIYAAYGNSKTPSQSSVNGSCTESAPGVAGTCNVAPESAKNYEIGIKAELGAGVLVTASAFRNERDSYRVPSNDPTFPDQVLDGQSRVDGIALSAIGQITKAWSITANYTYLDSQVVRGVSAFCLANPGPRPAVPPATTPTNPCGNSSALRDPVAGAELQNTPKHSGSIFTTYEFPFGLRIGYGATYQGSFAFNLPALATPLVAGSTALTPVLRSDDYLVHNAFVAFKFSDSLTAQVNVKNVTDELFYTRIRNNGWATPGDARSAVLTLNYRF